MLNHTSIQCPSCRDETTHLMYDLTATDCLVECSNCGEELYVDEVIDTMTEQLAAWTMLRKVIDFARDMEIPEVSVNE